MRSIPCHISGYKIHFELKLSYLEKKSSNPDRWCDGEIMAIGLVPHVSKKAISHN